MMQNTVGLAAAATVLSREKTRTCFNGLCDRLREELERNPRVHDVLLVELQVNLYYLAGTSKYRTMGNLFGIAKFTVKGYVRRSSTYVKIPEGEALNKVIERYKKIGFLNCEGAIDGTHIMIIATKEHHADIFLWNDQNHCLVYNLCQSPRQETHCFQYD